jgi:hypothetical protein
MATTTCPACGASAVTDGVCGRCGNASGDANRCPHCSAIARVEPKGSGASLRWVCAMCGGPRMMSGLGGEASITPLREARSSQRVATRARALSWVFGSIATFMTLVTLAAWSVEGFAAKLILLTLAAIPTLMAVRARSKASRATADSDEAIDRAMLAAAEDAASQAKKGVTVAELASRLKIDAVKAEKLLSQLAVHDRTRIDVDDDAEVRYSVGPGVDTSKVRVATTTEDKFRELEEAEARSAKSQGEHELRMIDEDEAEAQKILSSPFPRGPGR